MFLYAVQNLLSMIYEPAEDSYLLKRFVDKHAFSSVLDMGTGSGIQAMAAAKQKRVKSVLAVDVNPEAIKHCKGLHHKIKCLESDLFSKVKGKFDTIIFNPPYLPEQKGERKVTSRIVAGGKQGYELLDKFLSQTSAHLTSIGSVLIVFSSLTKKPKVDEIIEKYGFNFTELAMQRISFEELYVYEIKKSELLLMLEKKGISNIKEFAKGKRGVVYAGKYKGKDTAIKIERKDSKAVNRIATEVNWLTRLNKVGIGPKLLMHDKSWFAYEFVKGDYILQKFEKISKKEILKHINNIFMQCYKMDQLNVDKEEMHNPYKNLVIGKRPILIDFERAHHSQDQKNVTQFTQFVLSMSKDILKRKGFKINMDSLIEAAKNYKKNKNLKNLNSILSLIR